MHGVGNEAKLRVAQALPVDQLFDGVEIGRAGIEGLDEVLARRQRRNAVALHAVEFAFDLRDDGRQRAAAVAGFVLDAVPLVRIVAGGDDDAAGGRALAHQKRNCGSRARLVGQPDGRASGADDIRDGGGDAVRSKAVIVADQDAFARVFVAHDVAGDSVGDDARVREGEILGDDAAPAVRAKANRVHQD